jgi:multiple sugar transport system substrate-binding protein
VSAANGGSEKAVELFWYDRGSDTAGAIDKMVSPWRAAHPTWKLTATPDLDDNKLAALVAGGQQIDVLNWYLAVYNGNQTMHLWSSLDSYIQRDHWNVSQYNQGLLERICKMDGKFYALPYAYAGNAPFGFVYNRNLFKAAGVAEPPTTWETTWTWEQFTGAAGKLTVRTGQQQTQVGVDQFGTNYTTPPLLWEPAQWLADDLKTVTCDSQNMVTCYQNYLDLLLRDRVLGSSPGDSLGTGDPFYNGKAALTTHCCGTVQYTAKIPAAIDWAFAPLPKGASVSPDLNIVNAGIPTLAKQPDAGWSLLQFLLEKGRLADLQQRQPPTPDDAATWVDANYKDLPNSNAKEVILGGMQIARPIDPLIVHPKRLQMVNTVITPAMKSMESGKETAQQALTRIKPLLQAIVNS